MFRPRLFLITPPEADADAFAASLTEALAGGDVACVLLTLGAQETAAQEVAERLTPLVQDAGAAALIRNDTRIAGRVRADGVHMDTGVEDLKLALETFQPNRIVGAGDIRERHQAMEMAELETDYVFFGMLDLEERDEAHPKTLGFAEWWAEVFEIPCVALAGRDIATVREVARTRAEFVAVRAAVWDHPDGPRAAVIAANKILDEVAAELQAEEEAAG